ncbi:hypothetical protein CLV51_1011237 [Chitinophaga niastensis]|uniref:Uncharacterized protein n=1 Tax=Chitinophaga niastensis TaxID=536980 RepID=A0A2P8HUJ1_CHINA|nr:hypothetical protein [Chitinophaga niastensis]PSL49897.1 hypothetical protein CLV51_1011237 [Chitinophaga niastensis]
MLRLGGYINIIIALAHITGLFWADKMFEVTGIGHQMKALSAIHPILPYLLTVVVAIIFFVFGLYGLSATYLPIKLPFQKTGVFTIAGIYLLRGLGELIANALNGTNTALGTLYSVIAVIIGGLYLFGGLKISKV